jgi:class 3 adenylate cyclase
LESSGKYEIEKYIGDAVLAFFLVPSHQSQSQSSVACTRAINCARCMIQVAHEGINPIRFSINTTVL